MDLTTNSTSNNIHKIVGGGDDDGGGGGGVGVKLWRRKTFSYFIPYKWILGKI